MTGRQTQEVRRAPSPDAVAQHVGELLDRLAADPVAAETAEELVRALMDFYGTGLTRAVALLSGRSGNPLGALLDDEVTAGLLVLHDLHPDDVPVRIDRALRAADAATFGVEGFDADTGTLRLRQTGDGCGCGNTAAAVRERVESALACFAPEVTTVVVEEAPADRPEPVLLQIAARPPGTSPVGAR
ncbi:hypothetical protein POF50_015240 [Streptomyces sp. SL13]|uniref:NifU family protein n=1 Tax=Streptantibioticus silvisoli TaxID=2705255 RepID=A0AA90KGU2_9ACTN|nr:hypothetical protein [Streptantibioticus silvisoli]MDI5962250.1 hypothetical protein [Streptantibioticus silvisoli]MDI5970679.1 hypothetical protein [Streptantibioticus silvisoli]